MIPNERSNESFKLDILYISEQREMKGLANPGGNLSPLQTKQINQQSHKTERSIETIEKKDYRIMLPPSPQGTAASSSSGEPSPIGEPSQRNTKA